MLVLKTATNPGRAEWLPETPGGGGARFQFSWIPGAVDDPDNGIYSEFSGAQAAARAAADASQTIVDLICIDTTGDSGTVDGNTVYDMSLIRLIGVYHTDVSGPELFSMYVPAGVTMTNAYYFENMRVRADEGVFTYVSDAITPLNITTINCRFTPPATGFLFSVTGPSSAFYMSLYSTTIDSGDGAHFYQCASGVVTVMRLFDGVDVPANSFKTSAVFNMFFDRIGTGSVSIDQAEVVGGVSVTVYDIPYSAAETTPWTNGPAPTDLGSAMDQVASGESYLIAQAAIQVGKVDPKPAAGAWGFTMTGIAAGAVNVEDSTDSNYGNVLGILTKQLTAGGAPGEELLIQDTTNNQMFAPSGSPYFSEMCAIPVSSTFFRFATGFIQSVTNPATSDNPANDYMLFQYSPDSRGDANIQLAIRAGGGAQTLVDTGVSPDDDVIYRFVMDVRSAANAWFRIYRVASFSGPDGSLVFETQITGFPTLPSIFTWGSGLVTTDAVVATVSRGGITVANRTANSQISG